MFRRARSRRHRHTDRWIEAKQCCCPRSARALRTPRGCASEPNPSHPLGFSPCRANRGPWASLAVDRSVLGMPILCPWNRALLVRGTLNMVVLLYSDPSSVREILSRVEVAGPQRYSRDHPAGERVFPRRFRVGPGLCGRRRNRAGTRSLTVLILGNSVAARLRRGSVGCSS